MEASKRAAAAAATAILISILITSGAAPAAGQATKGQQASANNRPFSSYSGQALSPVAQARQQQQQLLTTARPAGNGSGSGTKRRPAQPIQQQQQSTGGYQREEGPQQQAATEDPLSDSEPALYGSVAGQPGVDFPAYTRIPKTSFTCDNKGFDFGFYADEETGCQAYHVCWSGRHESFLCGVGTVFNQAILACDYWHSVDCAKSSQFYSVNAELGKAGAEPASGAQRQQARLPAASQPGNQNQNANQNQNSFGEPLNQRRPVQQQQYAGNDEANYEPGQQQPVQQQQQVAQEPAFGTKGQSERRAPAVSQQRETNFNPNNNGYGTTFAPQRSFDYQQRIVHSAAVNEPATKSAAQPPARQQPPPTTTLATPIAQAPVASGLKRPQAGSGSSQRFNMDFNQKVNSLIESPVRAPLKSAAASPATAAKQRQQQQRPANFAQMAVARAQQTGSQAANGGRKGAGFQPVQQQQQRTYDADLEEPQQQQQQQQNFDDQPVQTSTAQSAPGYGAGNGNGNNFGSSPRPASQQANNNLFDVPQSQQTVVRAGNGLDGSSAITTQYDTLRPAGQNANSDNNNNNNFNYGNNNAGSGAESAYESSLDEPGAGANDDFRAAGAKAAASHNQNWYIMRTI